MYQLINYLTFLPLLKCWVADTALHSHSYVLKRALLTSLGSTLPLMPRALRIKLVIVGDRATGKVPLFYSSSDFYFT